MGLLQVGCSSLCFASYRIEGTYLLLSVVVQNVLILRRCTVCFRAGSWSKSANFLVPPCRWQGQ